MISYVNKGPSSAPSSKNLRKVRRLASRKRIFLTCENCKRVKRKCEDVRPCTRCVTSGLSPTCDIKYSSLDFICAAVDRPIEFCVSSMLFRKRVEYPQGNLKYHWSSSIIRPVWEIGHKYSNFSDIFNAIPVSMATAIANLLCTVGQKIPSTQPTARYV